MKNIVLSVALLASLSSNVAFCKQVDAIDKFQIQFTDHGYDCLSGSAYINMDAGHGGDNNAILVARQNGTQVPNFSDDIEVEIQKENIRHRPVGDVFRFWGGATFKSDDKIVTVKQNGGHTAYFERFGPTPEWPFKSKKDSQYFFTFKLDNGPVYKCKAIPSADE
jgi:hypothetical protein